MDVDEVLKELVERKTRMQSYSAFNLDAAVTELNDDYTRSVASSARSRSGRRDLKNEDVIYNLDKLAGKNSTRMKELVDHNNEESSQSVTKFDELMKRLKTTAAAHKINIATDNFESSTAGNHPVDAKIIDESPISMDKNVEEGK